MQIMTFTVQQISCFTSPELLPAHVRKWSCETDLTNGLQLWETNTKNSLPSTFLSTVSFVQDLVVAWLRGHVIAINDLKFVAWSISDVRILEWTVRWLNTIYIGLYTIVYTKFRCYWWCCTQGHLYCAHYLNICKTNLNCNILLFFDFVL